MMDAAALYATWRWHVDLVPPFRRPFMATSLGGGWGQDRGTGWVRQGAWAAA